VRIGMICSTASAMQRAQPLDDPRLCDNTAVCAFRYDWRHHARWPDQ
jgi:hypothetical protein